MSCLLEFLTYLEDAESSAAATELVLVTGTDSAALLGRALAYPVIATIRAVALAVVLQIDRTHFSQE